MMEDASSLSPYCLPHISGAELSAFDLYRRNPNVVVEMNRPVFCLIGANGIGKSTFLTTMLYGLTGGIPYRLRRFSSPEEYTEEATRLDRRNDYYAGRVSEAVTEHAAVTVALRWPDVSASVTRQLFGPGSVAEVAIRRNGDTTGEAITGVSADTAYRELVVGQSRLPNFEQFVFFMHYVCAFDEDRHLLLWDSTALTNALYLAFGSDAQEAAEANRLRREVERLSSRARNTRFFARRSLDDATQLQRALSSGDSENRPDEATLEQFESLNHRIDEAEERLNHKDAELRRSEAHLADRSAALVAGQIEYDAAFTARADASLTVRHHPLVRASLHNDSCPICAAVGVAKGVQSALEKHECPLCGNAVATPTENSAASVEDLKTLDQRIERARAQVQEELKRRARLKGDYEISRHDLDAAQHARDAFLTDNPNADLYADLRSPATPINQTMQRLLDEAKRLNEQSDAEYARRDKAREALRVIERRLQTRFEHHSNRLTDLFRSYATEFIGLAVEMDIEHRRGQNKTGFDLLLSLDNKIRVRPDDVSESQRFFLDIALRMALAQCMSPDGATLLIDTPEGSLDITYEARAGQMFSTFAAQGNAILMTANLNSSALLLRLAEQRKRSGMQVERMTDWNDMSDVQRAEEGLFVEAYNQIERALS